MTTKLHQNLFKTFLSYCVYRQSDDMGAPCNQNHNLLDGDNKEM